MHAEPNPQRVDSETLAHGAASAPGAEGRADGEPTSNASGAPGVPGSSTAHGAGRGSLGGFGFGLGGIVAVALCVHAWILAQAWSENPLVFGLQADAKTYWQWAERIAAGAWVGAEPFHVPPLYAYLLALLQLAGGGWLAVYVCQLALHLGSTALVGALGRRLGGPAVGLGAAALFCFCADAAFFVQRISPPSLQIFLVAWTWWEWAHLDASARLARAVRAGLALGLAVLANPVMLPAALLLCAWAAWRARAGKLPRNRVAWLVGVTALSIAPAPVHNWLAAREFIPVSTQGGLAFAIGNQPGAIGLYQELEGVSVLRDRQESSALALAREKTGDPALGWTGADRYFYGRGLDFWFGEPAAAAKLLWLKFRWFTTGPNVTDSYVPDLEIESGFASRLRSAPIQVAWLVGLAFVGVLLARRSALWLPGVVVIGLPLVAVIVYHYSARYRVPALPALAVFASFALFETWRRRETFFMALVGLALALGVGARWYDAGGPLDVVEGLRTDHERMVGAAYLNRNDLQSAERHLRRAAERGDPASVGLLAEVLRATGRSEDARRVAEAALAQDGGDAYAARTLARAQAEAGELEQAAANFRRALAAEPNDVESLLGLGNCLVQLGDAQTALAHYDQGLRLAPGNTFLGYSRGVALEALGRAAEAEAAWAPLAERAHLVDATGANDPVCLAARDRLIGLLIATGRYGAAIERLRNALAANGSDGNAAIGLAKLLASSPNDAERDGATALQLAEALRAGAPDMPQVLEVCALALAENGRFEEAAVSAATAAERARSFGASDFAAQMDGLAAQFRARRPYRLPPAASAAK